MNSDLAFLLVVIAICSYLSVKVWVNAQRTEREAYYRSEAIKKIAEMQGNVPESVLQVLRDAMVPKPKPDWKISLTQYPAERIAFYRNETIKKIAESPGGAAAALDYLREEDKKTARRFVEGLRLGGLITLAAGVGLIIFMRSAIETRPYYLTGLAPALVGLALLLYSYSKPPRE